MIFLLILIMYFAKYKTFDRLLGLIIKSIKVEQRNLLFYDKEKLDVEKESIKKYIIMSTIIIIFIDLIIVKVDFSFMHIFLNSFMSPVILFALYMGEVKGKYDKSYRSIHMELPIILQQIYCLLSINYSLEESIKEASQSINNPALKIEFDHMYNRLSRGYDLCLSLEDFFKEINSQYILRYKSVLISHYYYGGISSKDNFISLIYDLLAYRVLLLKENGEKIKVKIIIPIVIIFASTIISLALPIILNLNA